MLHAGILVEVALKLAICRHLKVSKLPTIFQVHDLELLFYCSGQQDALETNPTLQSNFGFIVEKWSMVLRYEGVKSQAESDLIDYALFSAPNGVLTFLTSYF